jgi:glycine betaine/proline transport system ATP-binding protein
MNEQALIRDPAATKADTRPVKLACRNVWKVFGDGAARLLSENSGNPTSEMLADAKLVGAVRSATIEVREGENFIVMGLSGSGKSTLVRASRG